MNQPITTKGTTLSVSTGLPKTNDQAGYEALDWGDTVETDPAMKRPTSAELLRAAIDEYATKTSGRL